MISELLNKGKDNAVTTENLMSVCNFSNKRDLTVQIAKERAAGELICSTTSGQGGYYLPKSREEVMLNQSGYMNLLHYYYVPECVLGKHLRLHGMI